MTEDDEAEIDRMVQEMGRAMKERNISPHGFAALAAFTAFLGAVKVLGGMTEGATKWITRIILGLTALLTVSEQARNAVLGWLAK